MVFITVISSIVKRYK